MAVSRIERMLLKAVVYGSLAFDPAALDPAIPSEEPSAMIRDRFRKLSREARQPFYDYFKQNPRSPIQIYKKSNCNETGWRSYQFHYEYDRPDQKTEAARLLLSGFDLSKLKGEYYTFAQLHELRRAHESGMDITPLLDNRYSRFQLKVLVPALRRGFDMTELMDPSIPARDMAAIYYDMYEQNLLHNLETQGVEKQFEAMSQPVPERKPSLDYSIGRAKVRAESESHAKLVEFPMQKSASAIRDERT